MKLTEAASLFMKADVDLEARESILNICAYGQERIDRFNMVPIQSEREVIKRTARILKQLRLMGGDSDVRRAIDLLAGQEEV